MITSVHIKNFKSLSDVSLSLSPITVLSGLNGMGKSTLIQSLLLLQQSYRSSPERSVPFLLLNSDLTNIGTAKDALWEGAERSDQEKKEHIVFGITANGVNYQWAFEYEENDDELVPAPINSRELPDNVGLFGHKFHYLSAERSGPRASFPISRSRVVEERAFGKDGGWAPFFLSEFGKEVVRNERLHHPAAASSQLRHQVEAWLSEVSPGTRIYTEPHRKLDVVSLEFAFGSISGETNHYRATNVGFGITYILPILLAALAAEPGSLLIIENPEAHLHPKGQVKIGELLSLASLGGVQVILETHSDHLLNGIRLAVHSGRIPPENVALHYFEREEAGNSFRSKITSPVIDGTGRLDQWPDGFFDEAEKSLRQLLRPRR